LGIWGRKLQKAGENCITKSFLICPTPKILYKSNAVGQDGLGKWQEWKRSE
jgi:hypothetical protein